MSSVSYPSLSGTVVASELNANFSDVVSLVSSVGNDQLAGGITANKIADRYTITFDTICVLPVQSAADLTADVGFTITATTKADIMQWQPVLQDGYETWLTSIQIYLTNRDTANAKIGFYLNGDGATPTGALIGGTQIDLDTDNYIWTLASDSPLTTPLIPFTNGDYITIGLQGAASGTAELRGLYVTFGLKHVLVG
jgi:hypothetical protein